MKLLVLGGSRFLGRHLARIATARKHQVTLFNRGNHPTKDQTNFETIQGDRNHDLAKLGGRHWDAVIDTCGSLPQQVRASAEVLSNSVDRYVFISSQNAYADVSQPGTKETAQLATLTKEQLEEANSVDSSGISVNYGKLYGGLKALSEQAAQAVMSNRAVIIRPGLIVGPDDYTDRFTYWPVRACSGGEVLAPGRPDYFLQFIDVRDLAEWLIDLIERQESGIYNAVGCPNSLTMERLLDECRKVSGSDASFTWVNETFLLHEKVAAWSELPLWLPEEAAPHLKGFMFINSDKAVAAGLKYRPIGETIKDTLNWFSANRKGSNLQAGLDRQREQALLQKWHEAKGE